ncbi:MAG: hypothetical protein IJ218_04370 [Alphaproteobacteria bacterium]|nr:hypothetical protein [Alphaproteobacteria bacterium]
MTTLEDVIIKDQHYDHLVSDNEIQRKTFLNYVIATLERPNIVVQKKDKDKENSKPKNHYFKFFLDKSEIKPHLQIVKVASDGSFYVTNYRTTCIKMMSIIINNFMVILRRHRCKHRIIMLSNYKCPQERNNK